MALFDELTHELDAAGERLAALRAVRRRRARIAAFVLTMACTLGGVTAAASTLWHDRPDGGANVAAPASRSAPDGGAPGAVLIRRVPLPWDEGSWGKDERRLVQQP